MEHFDEKQDEMRLPKEDFYTMADVFALPEGQRAELIDGRIYFMSAPETVHQRISMQLSYQIQHHIIRSSGLCEIFTAPFGVFLNADRSTYLEPDITVICSRDKIRRGGCFGAPDWIIEIVSPSSKALDTGIKLFKYRNAGVREYWIVDPKNHKIQVHSFEKDNIPKEYSFSDSIPSGVLDGLFTNLSL